jgi:hypothetical protein
MADLVASALKFAAPAAPVVEKEIDHVFTTGWDWAEGHKKTFHGIAAAAAESTPAPVEVAVVAPAPQSAAAPSAPSAPAAPAAPQAPAAPVAPIAPAAPVAASTATPAPASTPAPAGAPSSLLERLKAALGNDTSILAEAEKVLGGK